MLSQGLCGRLSKFSASSIGIGKEDVIDRAVEIVNEYYSLAAVVRRPSGYILADDVEIAQTVQCCHCSSHFISRKGSGVIRGFCVLCMRSTCGAPRCMSCVPFELKLAEYEKGKRGIL